VLRVLCRLTVKLRGRTTTSDERRGRTLCPSARGAKPLTPHGPLQRLLDFECLVRIKDLKSVLSWRFGNKADFIDLVT